MTDTAGICLQDVTCAQLLLPLHRESSARLMTLPACHDSRKATEMLRMPTCRLSCLGHIEGACYDTNAAGGCP